MVIRIGAVALFALAAACDGRPAARGAGDSSGTPPPLDRAPDDAAPAASAPRAGDGSAAQADVAIPPDWRTSTDAEIGVSFSYPPDLGTRYIHPVDWPPAARVVPGPFECTEAGVETRRAGRTEPRAIEGRRYCVTRESEGAAGSVYTLYAYAFPAGDRVVILTFSLRAVQCGNYDDPQRSECDAERRGFDVDPTIGRIAQTVELRAR